MVKKNVNSGHHNSIGPVIMLLSVFPSGLNEKAEPVTWQVSGWPARILQHELDHLDGVLYIDRMDSRTFTNVHWAEHND